MALPRSPGDNSTLTRNRSARLTQTKNGANTAWTGSYSIQAERDIRASYASGSWVSISGIPFRKSTSYSRRSWKIDGGQPCVASGYRVNKVGNVVYGRDYYITTDEGTESYLAIGRNPLIGLTPRVDARNEAVTKALNKIADQKVNLGENLATLKQTISMFTSKGFTLTEALQSIYRNKSFRPYLRKSYRDLMREGIMNRIAREYLTYVYGLKPLMQDVYGLSELMKSQSKPPLLLKAVGKAARSESGGTVGTNVTGSRTIGFVEAQKETQKVKCTLWARLDENSNGLRTLNQLGLANPISLAWDLMSYSFVVDWFVPVGPVLSALSARFGLKFVDGSISTRTSATQVYDFQLNMSNATANALNEGFRLQRGRYPIQFEGFNRSVLTDFPIPGLWFSEDPFRGDRSLKALALGILALKRF